jgi:hypothetical protein
MRGAIIASELIMWQRCCKGLHCPHSVARYTASSAWSDTALCVRIRATSRVDAAKEISTVIGEVEIRRWGSFGSIPIAAILGIRMLSTAGVDPYLPPYLPSGANRKSKSWVVACRSQGLRPSLVAYVSGLAGRGKTTLAQEYAHRHQRDFEAVHWLPCQGRSLVKMAGEIAWQLGLKLDGEVDSVVRQPVIAQASAAC